MLPVLLKRLTGERSGGDITLNGITKRFGGKTVLDGLTATLPGGVIA